VVVRKILRFSMLSIVLIAIFGLGIAGIGRVTPTGFLPEEDQGAFFVVIQLPEGSSVARTSEVVGQVEATLKSMPQVKDTISVIGYSFLDSFSASNSAFMLGVLQPFSDRAKAVDSVQALIAKTFDESQHIRAAVIFPFNLPPVVGLGTSGGLNTSLKVSRAPIRQAWETPPRDLSPPPIRIAVSPACSRPTAQPPHRFISTSTAKRLSRSDSRSATCLRRFRLRSAATSQQFQSVWSHLAGQPGE
jgi:hypothetical protein